jgi:hypothetical protein
MHAGYTTEDENEAGVDSGKSKIQEAVTDDEGKISHTQQICTALHSFITVLISCPQAPFTNSHHYSMYSLHFASNNFNYSASKLPTAALSQHIWESLEFLNFQK